MWCNVFNLYQQQFFNDFRPLQVKDILKKIAAKLPFKAEVVSQEIIEYNLAKKMWQEKNNQNPYTMEYLIKNNMDDMQRKVKRIDHLYFGKYV